tara:strand:- start:836 stop:1345 length:510 start_codon:yes stop_codon:yes gene_type:complete
MREEGDEIMPTAPGKYIGEYTARGVVSETETEAGTPQKISLFDGRFDTAYKVVDFKIWSSAFGTSSNPDCVAKLSKNAVGTTTSGNFMRADDDNQIAWAASAGSTDGGLGFGEGPILDPDNLVVEDLYVYARTAGTQSMPLNYLIVMEKYQIDEWKGALAMARDRADGE